MTPLCPHCRQPLINTRLGVRLTPLKARIFDAVRRAGEAGVTRERLEQLLSDRAICGKTVKAHVLQINELLAHTDWSIRSDFAGRHRSYHLVHRPTINREQSP